MILSSNVSCFFEFSPNKYRIRWISQSNMRVCFAQKHFYFSQTFFAWFHVRSHKMSVRVFVVVGRIDLDLGAVGAPELLIRGVESVRKRRHIDIFHVYGNQRHIESKPTTAICGQIQLFHDLSGHEVVTLRTTSNGWRSKRTRCFRLACDNDECRNLPQKASFFSLFWCSSIDCGLRYGATVQSLLGHANEIFPYAQNYYYYNPRSSSHKRSLSAKFDTSVEYTWVQLCFCVCLMKFVDIFFFRNTMNSIKIFDDGADALPIMKITE